MNVLQTSFLHLFEQAYHLPDEHRGALLSANGLTNFQPRKWTTYEEDYVIELKEKGLSINSIARALGRDVVQVSIKMKRIAKKSHTYNDRHREEKYMANDVFLSIVHPEIVLDAFAGPFSYYMNRVPEVYTNDVREEFGTYYCEPAEQLLPNLVQAGERFDLVDVDPFGSAYECLLPAIKLATRALVVTFGELGHRRFKRLDFVGPRYGITKIEDFTAENLASYVLKLAKDNGRKVELFQLKNWHNICRAYYLLDT
mgnify:CR=1 FL=1